MNMIAFLLVFKCYQMLRKELKHGGCNNLSAFITPPTLIRTRSRGLTKPAPSVRPSVGHQSAIFQLASVDSKTVAVVDDWNTDFVVCQPKCSSEAIGPVTWSPVVGTYLAVNFNDVDSMWVKSYLDGSRNQSSS
jgi:hypothetical protein